MITRFSIICIQVFFLPVFFAHGCNAASEVGLLAKNTSKDDCSYNGIDSLVGKNQKRISECFSVVGAALIGKNNAFSVLIIQSDGQQVIVLGREYKDEGFIIKAAMKRPKLAKGEAFLYGSCYTDYGSGIVNALAIVAYNQGQQYLTAKKSWIIDFDKARMIENKTTKITCVNESYGV